MTVTENPIQPSEPMQRKCRAHSKNTKQPCGNDAMVGGFVCRMHGGTAPQTKAAALRRILEAADPAAAQLVKIAMDGESESVRLQAVRDLLDRAGLSATQKIEQDIKIGLSREELIARAKELDERGKG